jgi:hypothetical protein
VEEGVTDATIVLVHGLAIVRPAKAMFTGVAEALAARGFRVARTEVQGDGHLTELAERLWPQLAKIDGPLVLLCHSMGGLESRTFLLDETRARKLRAIATFGSPHRGTSLTVPVQPFWRAYRDITRGARAEWMEKYGEIEARTAEKFGVRCLSAVASLKGRPRYWQLLPTHAWLQAAEGPNDGLVSAHSQRWGDLAFEVDLDHQECASISPPPRNARSSVDAWVRLAELAVGAEQNVRRTADSLK